MLGRSIVVAVICLLVLGCEPAMLGSSTYFGFAVDITNAPPPPRVVLVDEPIVETVSGSQVYVVENSDYDMFRFGAFWYVASGGYWYRASSYNGPYSVCEVRSVPRAVLEVPEGRWKHHRRGGPWDRGRGPGA
jgi:hypothetical protein